MSFLNDKRSNEGLNAPPVKGTEWINSDEIDIQEENQIILIDFWTYSCVNCLRTLPDIKQWHDKYNDLGLLIIGVHTPEFEFEKDPDNVRKAVEELGIEYPVVLDNKYETWNNYSNRWWPRKLLIGPDKKIRFDHIGEGGYRETENQIRKLLQELDSDINLDDIDLNPEHETENKVCYPTTPETYTGYKRGKITNPGGYRSDEVYDYAEPEKKDGLYLEGEWKAEAEALKFRDKPGEGYLGLQFTGAEVNAVLTQGEDRYEVEIELNDKPIPEKNAGEDVEFKDGKSIIKVDWSRMYRLIKTQDGPVDGQLQLYPQSKDFAIYAFTFGGYCK